ncbi:MAG: serine/threonine-protein phosphatase [Lachnospiraceae bacterium]|nr:serine/threonine-protein phosphatase [Lachnospiraceae bacterium]
MDYKCSKFIIWPGMILSVFSPIFSIVLSYIICDNEEIYLRTVPFLYDYGLAVAGVFVCSALFFGCMREDVEGTREFLILDILIGTGLLIIEIMFYTTGVPEQRMLNFISVILEKIVNLTIIYFFYRYIRITLNFKGRIAGWADKGMAVLLSLEILIALSNIFYPVEFMIDAEGIYHTAGFYMAENIYLFLTSLVTAILIIRSDNIRSQKIAALTFLFPPICDYIILEGEFGNASQYAMALMSLVIMFCIIFYAKSTKLASTQAELNMATGIQESMLPSNFPAFPSREEFDLYASMDPAKEVGGDFYDFFLIDDDHLGIVIADVSGKGVPAALYMVIAKTVVQNYAKLGISAADVLAKANQALCSQNDMEMFVTTWIGILEISTGRMSCANAGHEYPAICHEGRFELFKDKHGFVLGAEDTVKYIEYELQFCRGDKLFVYTDGVVEATDTNEKLFGKDRMLEALNTDARAEPKEILRVVRKAIDTFVGNAAQFDDLTMLCLEYRGIGSMG